MIERTCEGMGRDPVDPGEAARSLAKILKLLVDQEHKDTKLLREVLVHLNVAWNGVDMVHMKHDLGLARGLIIDRFERIRT